LYIFILNPTKMLIFNVHRYFIDNSSYDNKSDRAFK